MGLFSTIICGMNDRYDVLKKTDLFVVMPGQLASDLPCFFGPVGA
jgi:hypothetical protein